MFSAAMTSCLLQKNFRVEVQNKQTPTNYYNLWEKKIPVDCGLGLVSINIKSLVSINK